MAQMIEDVETGAREFHVPFDALPEAFTLSCGGEIVLRTAPGGAATALELHFRPTPFEFQAKLTRLLQGARFNAHPSHLSMAANGAQPVVVLGADPPVLGRIPKDLRSLPDLEAFLEDEPGIFRPGEYELEAISFETPADEPEADADDLTQAQVDDPRM